MQQVGFEHWTGCSHSWSHEWQTQSLRWFTHCQNVVDRKLRRAEVEEKEQMLLAWDPACLLPCCFTCSFWDDQIFVVSAPLCAWYISAIVCTCLHLQPPVKLRQRIFGKICTWQRCSWRTQHACFHWMMPSWSFLPSGLFKLDSFGLRSKYLLCTRLLSWAEGTGRVQVCQIVAKTWNWREKLFLEGLQERSTRHE